MKAFIWPVRIYYEDTDAGGVVYYANYLKFYERARTEMLRALGYEQDQLKVEQGIIFAVCSIQLDYLKPVKFNELINVTAELSSVKPASLIFAQKILRDGDVLNQAMIRIACLDAKKFRPAMIPETLINQLKNEY